MAESLTLENMPFAHGFFTRRGGVSSGPFASLNCSLGSPDDPDAVRQNRARVARALDAEHLLGLTQVHGAEVITVAEPWATGQGERADAMATDRPGLALGIVTADCAPVLFADPKAGVIGAAHAGWRGAVAGVLEATLKAMCRLGANPAGVVAAIGPCIAQPSYEVGADLRDAVLAHSAGDAHSRGNGRFFVTGRREGHWQFDLTGYCAARLHAAGVGLVLDIALDTLSNEDRFFSHRRRTLAGSGPIGHQISAIKLA